MSDNTAKNVLIKIDEISAEFLRNLYNIDNSYDSTKLIETIKVEANHRLKPETSVVESKYVMLELKDDVYSKFLELLKLTDYKSKFKKVDNKDVLIFNFSEVLPEVNVLTKNPLIGFSYRSAYLGCCKEYGSLFTYTKLINVFMKTVFIFLISKYVAKKNNFDSVAPILKNNADSDTTIPEMGLEQLFSEHSNTLIFLNGFGVDGEALKDNTNMMGGNLKVPLKSIDGIPLMVLGNIVFYSYQNEIKLDKIDDIVVTKIPQNDIQEAVNKYGTYCIKKHIVGTHKNNVIVKTKQKIKRNEDDIADLTKSLRALIRERKTNEELLNILECSHSGEYEERIANAFKEISTWEQTIESVNIFEENIVVNTKPIVCKYQKDGKVCERLMGRYKIIINISAKTIRWFNKDWQIDGYSQGMQHPHIWNNGSACEGNLTNMLTKTFAEMDIVGIVTLALSFLSSANTSDPAGKLVSRWPKQ